MRHRKANRKLGRTSSHRSALFRNQLQSMLDKERIVTTLVKAKELRPIVEKIVTLGKVDSVHTRRLAARSISIKSVLDKLFTNVSPRFADRPGGYTRIIKLGPRRGDGAEMAILEFVDFELDSGTVEPSPKKSRKATKDQEEAESEAVAGTEEAKESGDDTPKKKSGKPAVKKAATKKAASKKSPASKGATSKPSPKSTVKKTSKKSPAKTPQKKSS